VADRDMQPLMDFYQASRKDESFDGAIEATLRRLLVSPDFLFRVERMPLRPARDHTGSATWIWRPASFFFSGAAFRTMS
jgi:hypothetical protein